MKPKRTPLKALLGMLLLLITNSALALSDYHCLIQRIVTAESAPNSTLSFYEHNYLNKKFTVERSTGLMAGTLKNSYRTKPQVIDLGSEENSFKAVTTMSREQGRGYGSNVYMLTINEYVSSSKKPFVYVNNDVVFLGECEHF